MDRPQPAAVDSISDWYATMRSPGPRRTPPAPYMPRPNADQSVSRDSRFGPTGETTTDPGTMAALAHAAALAPPPDPYSLIAPTSHAASNTAAAVATATAFSGSASAAASSMGLDHTYVAGLAIHADVNPSGVYNPSYLTLNHNLKLRTQVLLLDKPIQPLSATRLVTSEMVLTQAHHRHSPRLHDYPLHP